MTAVAPKAVWRPYDDEPLFVPEFLVGFAALPAADADRLTRYLAALVASRGMPMHVAVAFNAVYFGYDLSFGGYVGGPVDFDRFPQVRFGDTTDALPVGAMVNVVTGSTPLYAEVVYKEGAHPELGAHGHVPAWLSGAPAGAHDPVEPADLDAAAVLSEMLVCDFDAFGQETVVTVSQLDRVRHRGRWLDADGHLLLESRYPSPVDAEVDDLEFYVRYLLTGGRDQLLEGPLPLVLTDDAQLEAALRAALGTVRDALAAVPSLQMWRHYAFTRTSLAQRLADPGPLGGDDLHTLARAMARAGTPARRRAVTPTAAIRYTAVGPWLRGVAGSAMHFVGHGYPTVVCHANTIIARHTVDDRDEHGLLAGGAHLRLDDPWQGGGIWRASLPAGPHAAVDPLVPLGLGWLDSQPAPTQPTAAPDEELDSDDDGGTELLSVTDSHLVWSVPLRLSHTLDGVVPLPARVVDECGLGGVALRLVLAHDGYDLEPDEALQAVTMSRVDGRSRLVGISWPLEFFPSIVLTFTWQRGAPLLRARSTLLEAPVVIDGVEYEHRYDPAVLTRDTAPGCTRRGQADPRALTLRQRVLRAVRRIGLLDADGVAVLPRTALPAAVYEETVAESAKQALALIVAELISTGDLSIDVASRTGSVLCWPASDDGERVEVLVWRLRPVMGAPGPRPAEQTDVMTLYVRSHTVAPFLRRLPPDRHASDKAKAEYRRLLARFGRTQELPAGYTLVREHVRGG